MFHKLLVNENKDSASESESQVSHNSTEKIEIRFYLLIVLIFSSKDVLRAY